MLAPNNPPDPVVLEKKIREQISEMERQVNTFNEAFGLLRAALNRSTNNETQALQRLNQMNQLAATGWEQLEAGGPRRAGWT